MRLERHKERFRSPTNQNRDGPPEKANVGAGATKEPTETIENIKESFKIALQTISTCKTCYLHHGGKTSSIVVVDSNALTKRKHQEYLRKVSTPGRIVYITAKTDVVVNKDLRPFREYFEESFKSYIDLSTPGRILYIIAQTHVVVNKDLQAFKRGITRTPLPLSWTIAFKPFSLGGGRMMSGPFLF